MKKNTRPKYEYRVKVQDIPNYGLIHVLDKGLQKQLDDLNEMKRLNHNIKQNSSY